MSDENCLFEALAEEKFLTSKLAAVEKKEFAGRGGWVGVSGFGLVGAFGWLDQEGMSFIQL